MKGRFCVNIFHSVGCLFYFIDSFFHCAKVFLLVKCNPVQLLFPFIPCLRRQIQKKISLRPMSECTAYVFFQESSFVLYNLTSKSLIHFQFIFVYGVRKQSSLILLHTTVQFSKHHLLKKLSFSHDMVLPPPSCMNCLYEWVHF